MYFEVSNYHTGRVYDKRALVGKVLQLVGLEHEEKLYTMEEEEEIVTTSEYAAGIKLIIRKVSLGELIYDTLKGNREFSDTC